MPTITKRLLQRLRAAAPQRPSAAALLQADYARHATAFSSLSFDVDILLRAGWPTDGFTALHDLAAHAHNHHLVPELQDIDTVEERMSELWDAAKSATTQGASWPQIICLAWYISSDSQTSRCAATHRTLSGGPEEIADFFDSRFPDAPVRSVLAYAADLTAAEAQSTEMTDQELLAMAVLGGLVPAPTTHLPTASAA